MILVTGSSPVVSMSAMAATDHALATLLRGGTVLARYPIGTGREKVEQVNAVRLRLGYPSAVDAQELSQPFQNHLAG